MKITRQDRSRIRQVMDYGLESEHHNGESLNEIMYTFCKLLESGMSIKEAAGTISDEIL
jgi:hypothetical protein